MKRKWLYLGTIVAASVVVGIWLAIPAESNWKQPSVWQSVASPGTLSAAHQHLAQNCAACHMPVAGVEAANCIVCHANNESLLQRQPTSFHASIGTCQECHREHQGLAHRPTSMDHEALAAIGLRQLSENDSDSQNEPLHDELVAWTQNREAPHAEITPTEAMLNCATCHANDDRHFELFGQDCVQCHATKHWTIAKFRHPSASSTDCAQCHQAPPSHYMMHFKMISARVASRPHTRVEQCFQCHQTTSWNDIQRAGWYKHH